jgi:hypothetical protein
MASSETDDIGLQSTKVSGPDSCSHFQTDNVTQQHDDELAAGWGHNKYPQRPH